MIVLVSHKDDLHTAPVLEGLRARGAKTALVDTSAFPQRAKLRMRYGPGEAGRIALEMDGGPIVHARDVSAVWWRRPLPMELHPGVSQPEHRRFAWEECDDALTGFWLALDARWVNHPSRYLEASRKPYQLAVAQAAGLAVPRTCITNDPAEARRFADELSDRQIVYKAFSGTPSLWTETQLLGPQMLAQVDAVRLAPVIFQEYVPGCDLRVTVVGDRVFAARIDASDTSYPLDWRVDPGRARIEAAELPGSVAEPLLRLHRRLGLLYGACDLRLTPDGEHVFLEVNPAGQWLFAEQGAGLPISDALADLLTDRRGGMGLSHGDERCVL